jgi:hypothetical protein
MRAHRDRRLRRIKEIAAQPHRVLGAGLITMPGHHWRAGLGLLAGDAGGC